MKLEILQENLGRGLSIVSRVLASKPQMMILSNVLLRAKTGQLEIIASNLETTVATSIGAKVEVSGGFTVPGRVFMEIVNGLPSEKIHIEVLDGNLLIEGGRFKGKINGMSEKEYPDLFNIDSSKGITWEFEKNIFLKAVSQTIFSVATDESRAVLNGILFTSNEDEVTLASTDGFRLSVVKIPLKGTKIGNGFILPGKTLAEVSKLLSDQKNLKLTLFPEVNQVVFDLGDTKIYSRLISGNFPDYEKIIPANSVIKIITSVEELLKAIKLSAIFARDSANIVKLKISEDKLKISANAPTVGENESEIDVQKEKGGHEDFSIAFNYRYLLDLLTTVGAGEITGEFNDPLASGVFRLPGNSRFLHLIMPVRVQGG